MSFEERIAGEPVAFRHTERPIVEELELGQLTRSGVRVIGSTRAARLVLDDVVVHVRRGYGGFDVVVERTVQHARQTRIARSLPPATATRAITAALTRPARRAATK